MSSPQYGVDYTSRMEGGLLGAMARAKERKRGKLAREAEEAAAAKARRKRRMENKRQQQQGQLPGGAATPPRPLVLPATGVVDSGDVALLLRDLNGGTPPSLEELLPVLAACGASSDGRVPAEQLPRVVVMWSRRVQQQGLPGLPPLEHGAQQQQGQQRQQQQQQRRRAGPGEQLQGGGQHAPPSTLCCCCVS